MLANIQHPVPEMLIYGGSFDPPHKGHLHCINSALQLFPASKIVVVPAFAPVSNAKLLKPANASFNDRIKMCRLAFERNKDLRVLVSSIEAEIDAPNYTLKTLRLLRQQKPQVRLGFLMGEDQWDNFSKWKDPQDILQLASILVVRRKQGGAALKEKIISVCRGLGVECIDNERRQLVALPSSAHCIYYQDAKPLELASSQLRVSIGKSGKICETEISDEVKTYIFSHRLYQ